MNNTSDKLIHLICGSTGAGKTTYALELANEVNGVHFSIDEWMVTLFGDDASEKIDPQWFVPRVARCEVQIWAMAVQLGKLGVPCILDLGFQRFEHRRKFRSLIEAANFSAKLHFLDVDASERWERVQSRNESRRDTFRITITRDMFDYIETIWEPPAQDELRAM